MWYVSRAPSLHVVPSSAATSMGFGGSVCGVGNFDLVACGLWCSRLWVYAYRSTPIPAPGWVWKVDYGIATEGERNGAVFGRGGVIIFNDRDGHLAICGVQLAEYAGFVGICNYFMTLSASFCLTRYM